MNRIKELRKKNNYTLADVAKVLGVGTNTISRYETGKREPKIETWQKLANYFDVSVPYLQGKISYKALDPFERGLYDHVTVAMDRALNEYVLLPKARERILKAIAYSIENGELNERLFNSIN